MSRSTVFCTPDYVQYFKNIRASHGSPRLLRGPRQQARHLLRVHVLWMKQHADRVLLLLSRLEGSADAGDKRDAVRELGSLLGGGGLRAAGCDDAAAGAAGRALAELLTSGLARSDGVIARAALKGLSGIVREAASEIESGPSSSACPLTSHVRDLVVLQGGFLGSVVDLFSSEEVSLALGYVRLFLDLQRQLPSEVEAALMTCPVGLQGVIDTLRDPREVIRNEAIRLLSRLTERAGAVPIKNLVAFLQAPR